MSAAVGTHWRYAALPVGKPPRETFRRGRCPVALALVRRHVEDGAINPPRGRPYERCQFSEPTALLRIPARREAVRVDGRWDGRRGESPAQNPGAAIRT
jgi:hypothetical protein